MTWLLIPPVCATEIGVVFQAQSIDVKLTAAENLMHQGHLYGLRGRTLKQRIDEMLGRVGLLDRAKEKAETFSGGMQRRLELAKGLLHHPQVLLLDEPTTGLDPGARRDVWQYLRMLRDEEHVTVIVDHSSHGRSRALRPAGHHQRRQADGAGNSRRIEAGDRRRCNFARYSRC